MSATPPNSVPPPRLFSPWRTRLFLLTLTLAVFLIHGYHPLADDGGLSIAGVEYKLNPTLFPHDTEFVTEHLRFSIFAPTVASIVHLLHLSLPSTLLLVDFLSIFLTLYSAHRILQHCVADHQSQLAGLCLLSVFWTLPIAGTSLFLMDPYLTARSLSTPLSLLAIGFVLDSRASTRERLTPALPCAAMLLVAALFHPLMAAYALAFIIALVSPQLIKPHLARLYLVFTATIIAIALRLFAPRESPAITAAEISRSYWFLSQWRWFELLGLAGPLIVLFLLLRMRSRTSALNHAATDLCHASLTTGLIAITIALLFAHRDAPTHLVARLQPLRSFLILYAIMTLLLGATLFQRFRDAHTRVQSPLVRQSLTALPALTLLTLAAIMFTVQRLTFATSPHLELPWRAGATNNSWVRAFLWARDNTPHDSLFALDANYVNLPGEEAQTFRAIALRSAIPDFAKDGGEAAIAPSLASVWQQGVAAQSNLSSEPDTLRDARLLPLGVTWLILRSSAPTQHTCPYNNGSIKVCRLHP